MQQVHKWEDYVHLVEFTYKNGNDESLGMSSFEVLYGRKCRVPTHQNNLVNKLALASDMLAKIEATMKNFCQNLKVSQDRQKVYANKKRTHK